LMIYVTAQSLVFRQPEQMVSDRRAEKQPATHRDPAAPPAGNALQADRGIPAPGKFLSQLCPRLAEAEFLPWPSPAVRREEPMLDQQPQVLGRRLAAQLSHTRAELAEGR